MKFALHAVIRMCWSEHIAACARQRDAVAIADSVLVMSSLWTAYAFPPILGGCG